MRWRVSYILSAVAVLGISGSVRPQEWPQWRGPLGQGTTTAVNLPPAAGSDSFAEVWKTPIPGEGCSSPIVCQGRVYVTTAYEGTERHAWDQPAAWASLALACAVVGLALTQVGGVVRGVASRPVFMAGLCAWTTAVVVLTCIVLAEPRWFWRFADPWTGTRVALAQLHWVESYFGRPLIVLAGGSLVLVFVHLAGTTRAKAENADVPPMLARWHRFVTLAVTVFSSVLLGLVGCRSEWFFTPNEPWLAWIVTGGLGMFALAGALGWLGPSGKWKLLPVAAALLLARWLFVHTPDDEFGMPLSVTNRVTCLVPAVMMLAFDAWVFLLPRRATDVRSPAVVSSAILLLTAMLGGVVFVRSTHLQPQTGVVRAVMCLDADTGEELWRTPVYVAAGEKRHSLSSMATPTPACDGERVFAYFGSGLAALDAGSGRVLWLKRDPEFAGFIRYGAGSSVALAGDRIILYRDSEFMGHGHHLDDDIQAQQSRRPSALIAHDAKTGDELWNVSPTFSHDSYMTPIVWTRDGRLEIVVATWKTLAGFSARDGSLNWSHPHPMQQIVPSPGVSGDCLYVMGGNQLPCPIVAIRAPSPVKQAPELVWHLRMIGGNISSPVCSGGLLFSMAHNGILTCQDAETGHVHWTKRVGRCLASLVVGDGKLYVLDQEGTLHVFAADKTGSFLASHSFDENCAATPALVEGAVFVRTEKHVIRLAGDASGR